MPDEERAGATGPPRMHADQLVIDADQVERLVAAARPEWAGRPVTAIRSQGTVNAIFRVGRTIAARFALQPDEPVAHRTALEREARRSARFLEVCPVAVPEPLLIGDAGEGYPLAWTAQSWVDGDVVDPRAFRDSRDLADDLIDLLATLRDVDVAGEAFRSYGRGDVLAPFDEWVQECLRRNVGMIDTAAISALWSRLRDLPAPAGRSLSHTDLVPGNVLVRDGRLVGLLDTGDASAADPALDLVIAWHLFDPAMRERMRTGLGSSPDEWARGAGWALVQAIGLVWYYESSNPVMSALGRSTLDRLATSAL